MTPTSDCHHHPCREELLKDAEEFSAMLGNATGFFIDTSDLVTDYFNRL